MAVLCCSVHGHLKLYPVVGPGDICGFGAKRAHGRDRRVGSKDAMWKQLLREGAWDRRENEIRKGGEPDGATGQSARCHTAGNLRGGARGATGVLLVSDSGETAERMWWGRHPCI